jgi:S-adenosylmethionine synthetase
VFFQHTLASKKIANVRFAHQLTRRLAAVRQQGIMQGLYPDGKAQVAIAYENNTLIAIANLVISTHHAPSLSLCDLRYQLIEYVKKPVIPDHILSHQVMDRERDRLDSTVIVVNPTGAFLVGGPKADAGLTGRKIIADTYGGMGRHGGGAFSGKDPRKVERSAASMARDIAKSVVVAELADVCAVQMASVIGHAHPVCVRVETVNPAYRTTRSARPFKTSLIGALQPLLDASTCSDRSIGPRLPMDILVARNSPGKPQTVS